jgi:glycosyltransferase involved in cell wall biosynthesis
LNTPSLTVVIPAFNEAVMIGQVVKAALAATRRYSPRAVVVVDDGSDDRTGELALAAGATVIGHPFQLGVGAATATGFAYALTLGHDFVVTLDGDGQHDPREIDSVVTPLLEGSADMVVGSRLADTRGMPWHRLVGNRVLSAITRLLYRTTVSDTQSGYRAYTRQALQRIHVSGLGHEICSELLWEARRRQLRVSEARISTIYTPYSLANGQSAWNGLNVMTRLVFHRLRD